MTRVNRESVSNAMNGTTVRWILGGLFTILCTICLLVVQSIAGDVEKVADEVKKNTAARNSLEGAEIPKRLKEVECAQRDIEKAVAAVGYNLKAVHKEQGEDRRLLNAIAVELHVPPAPEVAELPVPDIDELIHDDDHIDDD